MKPRRPTDFEVFNSNVKRTIRKSDTVTEDVQKSKVPFMLDTYIGPSFNYFSDNGIKYIEGKYDIIFKLSDIPLRANAYNILKSSTYCKPFVKAGISYNRDGVKKYYSTPSFSDNGSVLGVDRYLYTELSGNNINYYFLGDGTDGTVNNTKYYIKKNEVIDNYLVPFKMAIEDDKIIYPILIFIDGFFIPWSRCYFAISYGEFNIYINMKDLKYDQSNYLVDKVKKKLTVGDINPVFYMLPFEAKYCENEEYSKANKAKTIFVFDNYGRSYMGYSDISNNTKVTFVEASINIKNINEVNENDIYDQVSDLFYCEIKPGNKGSYSLIGKTVVNFNKLDRMRKLFPNNIIVFNKTTNDNLNLTLCTDTIRIYNNIVYVGTGTKYYDQHIKVFFDYNSALSLTNLEFVSQSWLQNYTDKLINFYNINNINYADSGELEVPNNENRPVGLKVINGILNVEYDPLNPDNFNLDDATQLGYTVKDGILCLEYDENNKNKLIINDNYISEQLNLGSLYVRQSMDMDKYNFDDLKCYYYNAKNNTKTELPINKSSFFNLYNKVYHNDVYNKNKGKLPIMDQTIIDDQVFEFKDIGTLNSIYTSNAGNNVSLKNMSFNDEIFINKIIDIGEDPVGKFKFVYIAKNEKNDRYGYTTLTSDLQPGSTIDPDTIKMRSSKFIINLMKDDLDTPLGLEVGYKGYQYNAKLGYTAYTDYTYSSIANNISGYTDNDGKLLVPVEVFPDEEHNSYYFTVGSTDFYVKEYSNEYYSSEDGKVINKTGDYNLNKEYYDFSGMMTTLYNKDALPYEARMNDVQLSNTEISVVPNGNTTVDLSNVYLNIDTNKYISNFDYSPTITPITSNFICTNGGSLTYETEEDFITVSDESLLYNAFSNRVGSYLFEYNSIKSLWIVNKSIAFSALSECGISYIGTDSFEITIKNDTYPSWTLNGESVDVENTYGIEFKGVCTTGNILSLTYSKKVTGLLEETYNEDIVTTETIMNDYLQLKLVDGVTNVVYSNYLIDNTVDPYRPYPGRVEFIYNSSLDNWSVTVYRYVTNDLIYKVSFPNQNLENFAIEFSGSPVNGDKIIANYEIPSFQWNLYKAEPTNDNDFINGYAFTETPIASDINISEYGVGLIASIIQSSIVNSKIYNESLLAEKLNSSSGTYTFTYDNELEKWLLLDKVIDYIEDYGISINESIPSRGDYITVELNTNNTPSWMDSLFATIYEVRSNCIEFPDGTYYNKEIAIPIIMQSYGIDLSEYLYSIKENDKIIVEYHNTVGIPRYILNLLINKFNYYDSFKTNEYDVEDTYNKSYSTYTDKLNDILKDYKLYEYQLSTMMLNNQSIFDKYLKNSFSGNIRFTEYTRGYVLDNISKYDSIHHEFYMDMPIKNRQAYMIDFEDMFLNFYTNNNLINKDDSSNIFKYRLALDKYSGNGPVEFIFFDNINNNILENVILTNSTKYKLYDSSIFNENMRLYSTEILSDNEFVYPEYEDDYPIEINFNIKYTIDKVKYKGILKPGSSSDNTIYTPAAAKGDFYYLNNDGYINGVNVNNTNTYRLLLCTKDVYDAKEVVFDEIKPSTGNSTCWKLISGDNLIDGLRKTVNNEIIDDYSILILDQEYINIKLDNNYFYNKNLVVASNNRFMYHQFQYNDPVGDDYPAKDNDKNVITLEDDYHNDIFKYCDDHSKYMIFMAEKTASSHKDYRYISSDQYRISIPNSYNSPYYERKVFFSFDIPEDAYILVLYLPISMQAIEFKQSMVYQDGTVIFNIDYESKKDIHYTLNSELYMVFADGKKIPQSCVQKIGPDRLRIKNPDNLSISYNNISIVKYIPTTLESRFDNYIDSEELITIDNEININDEKFMKYIMKVGLDKNDILNIIEKLAYRHNFASSGTSYYIDDTLTLNNYGSGMSEFVYWLYNDLSMSSSQKLGVFDYSAITMSNDNSFENNNKFIESTMKLIRKFYIENTLVPYNTYENPDPTFENQDNIASKSGGLTKNSRYANDPTNVYIYPALQDYRYNPISATYNLFNLSSDGSAIINSGDVDYSFYIYSINNSILPDDIDIIINKTGTRLINGIDYDYNRITGRISIFYIVDNFTVTAYGERVSHIGIVRMPDKMKYYTTEKFDPTGMILRIFWTDGTNDLLTDYTWDHYNELLTTDITEIIITYTENEYFNYTISIPIVVLEATPELNYNLSYDGMYYIVGDGSEGSGLISIPENGIVNIPDSIYDIENDISYPVKSISNYAFKNIDVSYISLGNNIITIGDYAFSGCQADNILLNNSIETIGDGAFENCININNLNIPNTTESIGIGVAKGCSSIISMNIPKKIKSISQDAFKDCTSLDSVIISNECESIGMGSFSGCTSLRIVDMGDSIKSIGDSAFYNCSSLESIYISRNTNLTSIKENTFNGCGFSELLIPNNINEIKDYAFSNCINLESVIFESPSGNNQGLNSLGKSVFEGCLNLTAVEFKFESSDYKCSNSNDSWFKSCNANLSIKVPITVYNPDALPPVDITNTNYGNYWTYIDGINTVTYYSN